jgi:hypothetical protein
MSFSKIVIFSTSLFILIVSCSSTPIEASEMEFCPVEIEKEAREILGIKAVDKISLEDLFKNLKERKIEFEESPIDNTPLNCKSYQKLKNSVSYKVYAGYDEKKEFVRSYLVVADENNIVRYIDKRHMYRAL